MKRIIHPGMSTIICWRQRKYYTVTVVVLFALLLLESGDVASRASIALVRYFAIGMREMVGNGACTLVGWEMCFTAKFDNFSVPSQSGSLRSDRHKVYMPYAFYYSKDRTIRRRRSHSGLHKSLGWLTGALTTPLPMSLVVPVDHIDMFCLRR